MFRFIQRALLTALISHSAAASGSAPPEDIIVAERGGAQITLADVDAYVMSAPKHLRATLLDDPKRIEQIVNSMLTNRQLAQWVRQRGAEALPHYQLMMQRAEDEFLAKLATSIHEDEVMASLPDFALLAEEIYIANPARFTPPPKLQLQHILVRVDTQDVDSARLKAENARRELIEGKEEFEEIFRNYSSEAGGQGAEFGGVLENIVPGMMERSFEDAVFALERAGDVTGIIETRYGLHVARLVTREDPPKQTFEAVRQSLIAEQRADFIHKQKSRLAEQMNAMELKASQPVVAQLRTRYAAAAEGALPEPVDGMGDEQSSDGQQQ